MATLYESIRRYEDSSNAALYFENKSVSFRLLHKNIRRAVSYLRERGIGKGDVVTVALPNIPATVYFFYALDAVGAVQNIVHPLSSFSRILDTMKETGSRDAILLETLWWENREAAISSGHRFYFANPMYDASVFKRHVFHIRYRAADEDAERIFRLDRFRRCPEARDITDRDGREDSVYLHSGGTTGVPKVISLSDDAISNLAAKVDGITGNIEGKSMLAVLPTFHGFGLGMGIHAPLSNGAASALMIKFNADKVIKWINRGKVNMIIGVPLLYQKLMRQDGFEKAKLTNIEYCFVGGDNVQPSLIDRFDLVMAEHGSQGRLFEGYGLTETVTVCTVNTRESARTGSVGKPLRGIEISIRDGQGVKLADGEIGEVYVSGDTAMNGYLGDPEATSATLVGHEGRVWVRTGDLGYIDAEGYLWLKGRIKRMFKLSGINVYPAEIEKLTCSHPDIREAALEYFPEPKPRLVLFAVKNKNATTPEQELTEQIMKILAASQLKYSLPSRIVFVERFPETAVGKIDHAAFEKMFENIERNGTES